MILGQPGKQPRKGRIKISRGKADDRAARVQVLTPLRFSFALLLPPLGPMFSNRHSLSSELNPVER